MSKAVKQILIGFLLLHCGCDLFITREAESPETKGATYQPAFSPDTLISNFINALAEKNTQNYIASFSDPAFSNKTFIFIPSAAAAAKFPVLADGWSLADEEQYFNNVISKVFDDVRITLIIKETERSVLGDSVLYSASYSLQGEMKMKLLRDSRSIWSIYYWEDIRNTNESSWSDLKGLFY
jgi:hypothetical protein